ncbi:tRNA-(ms[2]io[6]A)-hydroxylase [Pseudohaliea rubra]
MTTSAAAAKRSDGDRLAVDLAALRAFLPCATPAAWLQAAADPANLALLLADHANCEKKAAATALNLAYRYTGNYPLLHKLSRLAREELRHFEQVIAIMERRQMTYPALSASRYARELRAFVRAEEPERLVDTLLVGAVIEARSCERFAALAPLLDTELEAFYRSLLRSEARHFEDYLGLAQSVAGPVEVEARLALLLPQEALLIEAPDADLRFHSGPPRV